MASHIVKFVHGGLVVSSLQVGVVLLLQEDTAGAPKIALPVPLLGQPKNESDDDEMDLEEPFWGHAPRICQSIRHHRFEISFYVISPLSFLYG